MSAPARPEGGGGSTGQPTWAALRTEPRLPWLGEGRPRVIPDAVTAPFWEAIRRGGLSFQHCSRCHGVVFPPRPRCPQCLIEGTLSWSGGGRTGRIYSFAVAHYRMVAGFIPPYAAVVVELDDPAGVRLMTHLEGVAAVDLHIGMCVELAAPTEWEGTACPVFRRS